NIQVLRRLQGNNRKYMTGITGIVQTVPVLFCGGFGRVGAGENNAKFTENCVITLAKVSDFCYNVYRVGIGFDFNFHKKPYYITIL
ncbi:MAG: hypothetical protein EGR74_01130, partial [Ruminiclostridium sp.]|nr:hypothetical protein [Ruminiclostridium sp.]